MRNRQDMLVYSSYILIITSLPQNLRLELFRPA